MKKFFDALGLVSKVDSYFVFIIFISSSILLFFEILSLGSLLPLISFLTNDGSLTSGLELLVPYFTFLNENNIFTYLGLLIFTIFSLRTLAAIFLLKIITSRISNVARMISMDIYSNLVKKNYKDFIKSNSSQFIREVHHDVTLFGEALRSYINLIMDLIILMGAIIILSFTNPIIMSSLIISFGVFILFYILIFYKKIIEFGEIRQISLVKMLEYIGETYRGFKAFKLARLENFYSNSFSKITRNYYDAEIARIFYSQLPKYILEYFILFLAAIISLFFLYFKFSFKKLFLLLAFSLSLQ